MIPSQVFKAYDIRGIAGTDITDEFAYQLGLAFVHVHKVREVAVGYDARVSSPTLADALTRGLTDAGATVYALGMVATDMVYFATGQYQYEAGIMVTASHNPGEYNGFKACFRDAVPVVFDAVKECMVGGVHIPLAQQKGSIQSVDIYDDWISFLLTFINVERMPHGKIVVDAGNGVAGKVCTKLFEKLPMCELVPLYFEPDGRFPNHPAYPLEKENLVDIQGRMEQEKADIGLAFDGDADRVVLIDDAYNEVSGTVMTAMIIDMMLKKDHHQTFVYNALVGEIVPEIIAKYGARGERVRVGHTFMKQAMKEYGAVFGGEHSAHYYFQKNWNADSGIIAALIVLELLGTENVTLSHKRKEYEKYVESGEINFTVEHIDRVMNRVISTFGEYEQDMLDGVTIYGEGFWANVRPSNTEPLLRLNVEADSKEKCDEIVAKVSECITKI